MAEATTVKMRYKGPAGSVAEVGPLVDNKVYEVGEPLARRLLVSHGWKPSGEEAQAWAEKQTTASERAVDDDAPVTGEEAAESGYQEGQGGLGEAQHESEGDPSSTAGEKGAGSVEGLVSRTEGDGLVEDGATDGEADGNADDNDGEGS